MIKWRKLDKSEADTILQGWGGSPIPQYEDDYAGLREELIHAMELAALELQLNTNDLKNAKYDFDLLFGLKLFHVLTQNYKLNARVASDDGVWRYLSVCVVPDVVFLRWGMNPGRFWKESRRVWLKALWWYIYLSWQGSTEGTYEILKGNTTDEVVQLVERSGPFGYRVELCRKIMKYYGSLDVNQKKRSSQIFRRIMKLNTARVKVVEPALLAGGEEQYVKELFEYFEQSN